MAFTQKLPEWNAPGVEPSATQKQTGFQPGMKPPAQWFNWHLNWSYLALKELQEKAAEKSYVDTELQKIRTEIEDIDLPDTDNWQKYKLTKDNGSVKELPNGYDLNDLGTGVYAVTNPTNGPKVGSFFVEDYPGDAVSSGRTNVVVQRATSLEGRPSIYTRTKVSTTWYPWVLQTPEENLWGAL